jgi:hypothetical protein
MYRCAYNDDGLALVRLGVLLVGGGGDDLGQADRCSRVSLRLAVALESVGLRGRLTLDIMSLRRTTLLKGASVRPRDCCQHACHRSPGLASASAKGRLTGEELVEPHEELDIGVLALRDLCKFWSIPHSSEIMLRPRGQLLASALRAPTRRGNHILRCPSRT